MSEVIRVRRDDGTHPDSEEEAWPSWTELFPADSLSAVTSRRADLSASVAPAAVVSVAKPPPCLMGMTEVFAELLFSKLFGEPTGNGLSMGLCSGDGSGEGSLADMWEVETSGLSAVDIG